MRLDIDPKTQREEWLAGRRKGLGSSDAPAILLPAHSRPGYMSPWKVWRSKVEGVEEEVESLFMDFGNRFERSVGEHVAAETGLVLTDGGWYGNDDRPWMMASPDFWLAEPGCIGGLRYKNPLMLEGVEAKVIQNSASAADWLPGSAPPHVTIQAHWCMAVTGAKRWHIAALLWFQQEFRHYVIEHDQAFQDRMIAKAHEWWEAHVVRGEPPPIDHTDACKEAVAARAPTHNHKIRDANDIEAQILANYVEARDVYRIADAEKKRCENLLKSMISGDRGLIDPVAGKVMWSKCAGRAGLDQKALKAAHPEIFAEFIKRGEPYRRISYAKPKVK